MFATMRRQARLVGRDPQVATLREAVDASSAGTVLVRGHPGSGRTRLVEEALPPEATVWLRSVPLGPSATSGSSQPPAAPAPAPLPSGTRVVVIDDADHLDVEAAADLRGRVDGRDLILVLVVATDRDAPAALAGSEPPTCTVEVTPLSEAEADTLLDDLLRAPVDRAARRRLRGLAEGSPRFLELLVEDGRTRGQLGVGPDGVVRLVPGFEPSATVLAAADDTLAELSAPAWSALTALTLARSLPTGLATRVADPGVVAELATVGAIHREDGVIRVGALTRRAVVARLDPLERAEVARRLLSVVGDAHPDAPLVPAAWCLDAGLAQEPAHAREAATIAGSRGDHRLAERLLRAVRQDGHDGVDVRLALAKAEVEGPDTTDRGLARFAAIAATPGHAPAIRAAAAEGRAVGLLVGRGDAFGARRVARAAHLAFPDHVAGVRAGALAACLDVLLGDVEAGVDVVRSLPDLGDPSTAWIVGSVDALARAVVGDLAGAADRLEALDTFGAAPGGPTEREDVGTTAQHPPPVWAALAGDLAATLLDVARGRLVEARARANAARDRAEARGSDALTAAWHVVTAHLAVIAGDLAAAERSAIDADRVAGPQDPCGIGRAARCQQALVAAQRGAVHLVDELLGHLDDLGFTRQPWLEVDRCRVLAWSEYADGRPRSAAKLAVEAGEVALDRGRPLDAAVAFGDAVRFGHPELALPGAERVEARCPGGLTGLIARQARAAVEGNAEELRQVGDDLLAAGLRLPAVEAWLAAADLVPDEPEASNGDEATRASERLRRRADAVLGPEAMVPITVTISSGSSGC